MTRVFNVLHLYAGSGFGALGFQQARTTFRGIEGRFRTLAGVDIDGEACADFRTLTGAPCAEADLATMTREDLLRATNGEAPDVLFSSPPCKGFSGLLSAARLTEDRYKKLNALVFQGIFLALETWPDTPPKLIVIENVPRITSRGAELLSKLRELLAAYGYKTHEGFHDCGEVGGLAQHRRRFLLVARHERQVPAFVYQPPKKRVRAIGEVLSELPMPDDPRGGPMHRLSRLTWKTWVRLALIPAGGDWRALGRKDEGPWHGGAYGIVPWDSAAGTVTGNGTPGSGRFSVADPRLPEGRYNNQFRIVRWDEASVAITGGGTPTSGGVCVADPRPAIGEGARGNLWQVEGWNEPASCITGAARVSSGALSIADPRFTHADSAHRNKYRVENWTKPTGTVIGSTRPGSGAMCIADPRITMKGSYPDLLGVLRWDRPAKTVSGKAAVTSSNCPAAVADPRFGPAARTGSHGVVGWSEPIGTVTGEGYPSNGAFSVADVRIPADHDRPDPVPLIIALDGTWHRPLTTLELAALQGLPVIGADGMGIKLAGDATSRWRERIGNGVPPPAARAVGESLLQALLAAEAGASFVLGSTDIWVRQEEEALAL